MTWSSVAFAALLLLAASPAPVLVFIYFWDVRKGE